MKTLSLLLLLAGPAAAQTSPRGRYVDKDPQVAMVRAQMDKFAAELRGQGYEILEGPKALIILDYYGITVRVRRRISTGDAPCAPVEMEMSTMVRQAKLAKPDEHRDNARDVSISYEKPAGRMNGAKPACDDR